MSKPEPKFALNERVMIRSLFNPKRNHDNALIIERIYEETINTSTRHVSTGWRYRTDKDAAPMNVYWQESALKPRPKPATATFTQLMESIKGVGVES